MGMHHRRSAEARKRRREQWLLERDQRHRLRRNALWEPLERESILMETVVFSPREEDVHNRGEVLWDRHWTGSFQLVDGKEPPVEMRVEYL